MGVMLSREQRAEVVQSELSSRGWTRHNAHRELEISRPAMEKLWDGRDVELEIVERFARGLGLDVNEWRGYWGYEPVLPTPSLIGAVMRDYLARYGVNVKFREGILRRAVDLLRGVRDGALDRDTVEAALAEFGTQLEAEREQWDPALPFDTRPIKSQVERSVRLGTLPSAEARLLEEMRLLVEERAAAEGRTATDRDFLELFCGQDRNPALLLTVLKEYADRSAMYGAVIGSLEFDDATAESNPE